MYDIGLNLLFLHPRMAGVRVVATHLLRAILELSRQQNAYRFRLFTTPAGEECLNAVKLGDVANELGNRFSLASIRINPAKKLGRLFYEQSRLIQRLGKVRLLHSFDYMFPFLARCRHIVTVHDLHYLTFPQTFSRSQRWIRQFTVPLAVRRADRVFTVSATARKEIVETFAVPPQRLCVIHNAFQPSKTVPRSTDHQNRFLLSLGTLKPHKNYQRLIAALALLDDHEMRLVIVGRNDGYGEELRATARDVGVADRVELRGFVSDDELATLFSRSQIFVFPSLYEGFGMPILEAMSREVPVACSDIAATREVGAGAPVYFDPRDPQAIADAVNRLLASSHLRDQVIAEGLRQTQNFSWSHSAKKVLHVYDELLK